MTRFPVDEIIVGQATCNECRFGKFDEEKVCILGFYKGHYPSKPAHCDVEKIVVIRKGEKNVCKCDKTI